MKICTKCKVEKAEEEFSKRADRPVGRMSQCKQCKSEARKRWGEKNQLRLSVSRAKYYKENRDKELKAMALWKEQNRQRSRNLAKARKAAYRVEGISVGEAYKILDYALEQYRIGDKYIDVYDGVLIERPSVDHIIPIHHGGTHTPDNLCVTSEKNNNSKRTRSLVIFLLKKRAMAEAA